VRTVARLIVGAFGVYGAVVAASVLADLVAYERRRK